MSAPVGLAVLGAGRIGRLHAENLAFRVDGARLRWVVDVDGQAARAAGERTGARHATAPERALEDPEVRGIVVCTPTDTHAHWIAAAAAAGKDVFCEKPIDVDLARVDEALAAVARAGVRLAIGFNRRYDPGFRRAREQIAAGLIGTPELVRITSRDPQPPPPAYVRASGGLFVDMTIHDFDVARWILGREIEEVYAVGSSLVDPEIAAAGDVDTAVVTLRYQGGALGAIDNSRRAVYGYDVRLEVLGSEGAVAVGNVAETTVALSSAGGVTAQGPRRWFLERFDEAYLLELRDFVRCLREDRAPDVGPADGRAPVALALAATRSLRQGRPVRVAEVG